MECGNPMGLNGKLIPVDIEIPASTVVRVEKRCWNCDSLSRRCSFIVIDQVGSTATKIVRMRKRAKPGPKRGTKRRTKQMVKRRVA